MVQPKAQAASEKRGTQAVPDRIGKYVIINEVGQGSTGRVFLSHDPYYGRDVEIKFKCAKGLHYAHGRGVIHRDIKPSNIMLTLDNDVRVIDFGIALIKDSDVSRIEGIAGSPSYMSPEQVQSAEITHRSDIYSLGAVMYELLTGYRPFRANSLSKLLHQIVFASPAPIHTLRAAIPEELEEGVMMALR